MPLAVFADGARAQDHPLATLLAKPNPEQSGGEWLETVYGALAREAGEWADKAAKIEGKREGEIAGLDPAWRPSGSTTIRGAAADEAGQTSYFNNLDAKLRTSLTDAYQQHQNDPTALKAAFDTIKASMMDPAKGDVFPEIASSFNASFERLRLPFQIKALDNFQGQQRDQARASAVVAASAGETVREQGIRALPRAPETRQAVEATLVEDDLRDGRLVALDLGAVPSLPIHAVMPSRRCEKPSRGCAS